MDTQTKESFYNSRLFQFSLSNTEDDERTAERKKLKQLRQTPLEDEILKTGLGSIGKTANGDGYNFLSFKLVGMGIFTVLGIEKHIHLQQIDISNNNLTSLRPLSGLKYLTHLNASNNKLTKIADFTPPNALEVLDLSNNEISEIPDMSAHRFLRKLYLSNNSISDIQGLEKNKHLEVLQLNFNNITDIGGLDDLNLTELHLFGNSIKRVVGLTKLPLLRILDLSRNKIRRIKGLAELSSLRQLYLSDNDVSKIQHLNSLEGLSFLSDLDLCVNPIQKKRHYRFQVLYKLPQLRSLDGVQITNEESVKAENFFAMDVEERKAIFNHILPEEDFVDRRIYRSEFLDPESDSGNDDIEFIDEYDKNGLLIKKNSSKASLSKSKSGAGFRSGRIGSGSGSPLSLNSPSGTTYKKDFISQDDVVQ